MTTKSASERAHPVGWAAAVVVFAPLLTTGLSFRGALVVQATLMLAVVLALFAIGAARTGWHAIVAARRPLLVATGLYAAAAVQGALVGAMRGNDPTLIAGQFLSLSLLPLATLATLAVAPEGAGRAYPAGVVCGVTAGALTQFVAAGPETLRHFPGDRLMLPNAVSMSGAALMALVFGLALARSRHLRERVSAWAATVVILVLIFVCGLRSQWLVVPVGLVVLYAVGLGPKRLFSGQIAVVWGTALVVLAAVVAATAWWWMRPRPSLTSGPLEPAPRTNAATVELALPSPGSGAVRVRGTLVATGSGRVYVRLSSSPDGESASPETVVPLIVAGAAPSEFFIVHRKVPGERRLVVRLEDPARLGCRTTAFVVEEIGPAALATLVGKVAGMLHRPPDPGAGATPGSAAGDSSVAFRLREGRALLAAIGKAAWPWRLVGQGLGATFDFNTFGYDNRGHVVRYDHPNYIHNFYLFLLFKLGITGSLAVLGALALFLSIPARNAFSLQPGTDERWFQAAALAAWVAYLAWSVAAPEILDFRMAPLWGMLAATTAVTRPRT